MEDGYREMTIAVPEYELDESFFVAMTEFAHDFLRKRATDKGWQKFNDCGNEEAPGCYGCNVFTSAQGVRP